MSLRFLWDLHENFLAVVVCGAWSKQNSVACVACLLVAALSFMIMTPGEMADVLDHKK